MPASAQHKARKRRNGELRVRSGCWKCRERRVKCPEQRPVCSHCQRLGFSCHYEMRLSWQRQPNHGDRLKSPKEYLDLPRSCVIFSEKDNICILFIDNRRVLEKSIGPANHGINIDDVFLRSTISNVAFSITPHHLHGQVTNYSSQILHDCSRSWEVHATFARSFLMSGICHKIKDDDFSSSLYAFASTYFVYHDALAFTASPDAATVPQTASQLSSLIDGYDSSIFMTLTGCSKRLIELLSQITSLANSSPMQTSSRIDQGPPEGDVSIRNGKRDSIERELHQMQNLSTRGAKAKSFSDGPHESEWISELKRLTSLMYLYARIDGCNPSHPHIFRLTTQILEIIPKISLRTNTLLWPLFTVATLGIRSDSDEDRRMILEKLHLLQQTRQLGNVRKARRIIEDVWKARDLKTSNAEQGWSILAGRYDTISLA
ncbi:sterol uptake control protein 2 [Colletotrichum asianum]|uniref:Sterol uptake control protein 2 n=1 Tax=Colletotrichum asianum TaxID=702518 RepID=A0A8H3ZNP9_9PEZI|nr:sterol uptake control protein 2 [Colletotrichum asianum]